MFISSFPPNYNIDKIKTVFIRSRAPDLHSLFYTLEKEVKEIEKYFQS